MTIIEEMMRAEDNLISKEPVGKRNCSCSAEKVNAKESMPTK